MTRLSVKNTKKDNVKIKEQLESAIEGIDSGIEKLRAQKLKLEHELIELEIAPFKVGDYALVNVPSGKSKKEQKCLLEVEKGILYARPVTKDGVTLSKSHYCVGSSFNDLKAFLKEVK